jgi:Protein of unknown function (DUF1569)
MPTTRRQVLAIAVRVSIFAPVAGISACTGSEGLRFGTLAVARESIIKFAARGIPKSDTVFSWAQTLNHLAQSIEYSMVGFPESKSVFFQKTAGTIAFTVFAWRGKMTHSLSEPILGAPSLDPDADPQKSLERLLRAITAFHDWSGALKPHFAYGELDRKNYELAHAMHIADHVSQFHSIS